MKSIIMKKLDPQGKELWRYPARLVQENETMIQLEAPFNGRELELMGTPIHTGDIFKETFFKNRWYNIFAIHDRMDGSLKGWYCNIGMPVQEEEAGIFSYIDLALDIWMDVDKNLFILDEQEFHQLNLEPGVRTRAISALEELKDKLLNRTLLQNNDLQE